MLRWLISLLGTDRWSRGHQAGAASEQQIGHVGAERETAGGRGSFP